ncbi:hypothetical protein EHF36_10285 [Kerstersia gyiorum]|uniref:hypothetical protein n=1 Tax=Kerstersia gyiorum TaxID=206506 RepID=UPI0010707521|nr:hypothetical protein [Kerstersia gyiorum]QBR40972.1 hypothetical protein EHF36_10285 [Kerstersia gyiorum]
MHNLYARFMLFLIRPALERWAAEINAQIQKALGVVGESPLVPLEAVAEQHQGGPQAGGSSS